MCKHAHMDTHTIRSSDQERREASFPWIKFLFSKGQVYNDPAKMDRKIVLWSDPQMQIGRGSICQCLCVSCTSTDLTAPLGLARWVGAMGPWRAKGKDKLREKKAGQWRWLHLGMGAGWLGMHASHIGHAQLESKGGALKNIWEWRSPLNRSKAETGGCV